MENRRNMRTHANIRFCTVYIIVKDRPTDRPHYPVCNNNNTPMQPKNERTDKKTHGAVERLWTINDLTLFVDAVSLPRMFSNVYWVTCRRVQQTVSVVPVRTTCSSMKSKHHWPWRPGLVVARWSRSTKLLYAKPRQYWDGWPSAGG